MFENYVGISHHLNRQKGQKVQKKPQDEDIPAKNYDFLLIYTSCLKDLFKNVRCNKCNSKTITVLLSNEKYQEQRKSLRRTKIYGTKTFSTSDYGAGLH